MKRLLVVALLVAAQLGAGAAPASAASADGQFIKVPISLNGGYIPIVGAFDCDAGDDNGNLDYEEAGVLLYAPGTAKDYLWTDLESSPSFSRTQTSVSITGTYKPVVGDFDGDRCDDILWYGPGSVGDSIWWGGPTGFTKGSPINISGDYVPVPGFYGSAGIRGIFWYAPNGSESVWEGTGNRSAPFRNLPARQVSGTGYRPVYFSDGLSGGRHILWHGPGSLPDSVWRLGSAGTPSSITQVSLPGTYATAGCPTSAVLHDTASGVEKLFTLTADSFGSRYVAYELSISGAYRVAGSGTGVRRCHVVWHRPGTASDQIWLPSS